MSETLDITFAERIRALEVETSAIGGKVVEHAGILKELDAEFRNLVGEIGKIRAALYFMAAMMGAQVLGAKDIVSCVIKALQYFL